LTQARLEFADHDLEGSAQAAKAALRIAKAMHSQIEEANVRGFYSLLSQEAPNNPYVNNLGLELGIL